MSTYRQLRLHNDCWALEQPTERSAHGLLENCNRFCPELMGTCAEGWITCSMRSAGTESSSTLSGLFAARVLPRKVCRFPLALPITQMVPDYTFPSPTLCQSQERVCFQMKTRGIEVAACPCRDRGPSPQLRSWSRPAIVASHVVWCGTPDCSWGVRPPPHASVVSDPGFSHPLACTHLLPSLKPCRMLQWSFHCTRHPIKWREEENLADFYDHRPSLMSMERQDPPDKAARSPLL